MAVIDFYFGIGSRYSYLAATQIDALAADCRATVRWRALHSGELIARAGADPFRPDLRRGQYNPAYRTLDAQRWAAAYGVPYREPAWDAIDWQRLALACVAADRLGAGPEFAKEAFAACFAEGRASIDDAVLGRLAARASLDPRALVAAIDAPDTAVAHRRNLNDAAAAGAFGVPTFVLDSGEMFWGQDRLTLLRHRLKMQM
ncbi:MAG: 2-hydroxychromene-2-carboxylate isomerase [Rhodospirillaceae bacterium]|nr:2-hydroxychromene-2-carboxylate isomerase [Rhodospirillaceae bacterium]